jgi:hypothetical protein
MVLSIIFLEDKHKIVLHLSILYEYPGADLGFVVRGGVSRRWIWGPLKVPSGSRGAKLWGFEELQTFI